MRWAARSPVVERVSARLPDVNTAHPPSLPTLLAPLERSLLMGVVNATVDSFSDAGRYPDTASRIALIDQLVADGADVIDIGGQSAITGVPETDPADEAAAVEPLVAHVARTHPDVLISVDTYKPAVVEASLAAGAHIINDVSGLRYPAVAELVAASSASLVVMHNLSKPKERLTVTDLYDNLETEVLAFISERVDQVVAMGVAPERIIVDPGPDFSKTPHQTVAMLRHADDLLALGFPVLMAVSRKDFIGAVLGRAPDARQAGTLGVMAALEEVGSFIYRVHDVASCRDFLTMRAVMRGEVLVSPDLELAPELRRVRKG